MAGVGFDGLVAALVFLSSSTTGPFDPSSGLVIGANVALNLAVAAIGLAVDFVYNVVLVAKFGGQPGKFFVDILNTGPAATTIRVDRAGTGRARARAGASALAG
jgi:hypothetical protein